MKNLLLRGLVTCTSWLLIFPATTVHACSVCMGGGAAGNGVDGGNGLTDGALNGAIFTLLGCIFSMLGLIAAVGISFVVRARRTASFQADLQTLALPQ